MAWAMRRRALLRKQRWIVGALLRVLVSVLAL